MKRLVLCIILVVCLPIQANLVQAAQLNVNSKEIDITDSRVLTHFYYLWKLSFFGREPNRVEAGSWIILTEQDEYEFLLWEITPEREKISWNGPMPSNTVGLAHTHPQATDPRPSGPDRLNAARLKIPIYTISRKGIWKVTPDGNVTQEARREWSKVATSNP